LDIFFNTNKFHSTASKNLQKSTHYRGELQNAGLAVLPTIHVLEFHQ
jgi:hypothetical protein